MTPTEFYLVDHTGTRRIGGEQDPRPDRKREPSPAEVHVGRAIFELAA